MTGKQRELWYTPNWFPFAVGALALVPFLPLLCPDDRVFAANEYVDYASFYLPIREFARDEFRNGRFPAWIPWLGCGLPLHASGQPALCYPLATPLLVLLPVNFAMRCALFGHLAFCFAGQYRLARALGVSRASSSFAGIIPTQSGYVIAHLMAGHVNHVIAFGLTPWVFVAIVRHLRQPSATAALALAVAGALLVLSGHPQPAYYVVFIGGLWGLGSLIAGDASQHRLRCVGWTLLALTIALLLASIQLLPTFELLRNNGGTSERGTAEFANMFAMDSFDLLHFLMPNLRGNPFAGLPDFPGYFFYHERAGYVGLATLILGLYTLTRASSKRWEWGASVFILLSLVIALGTSTPLFGLIGKAIPGLFMFRCPGRIVAVVSVLAGLIAARGLDVALAAAPMASGARLMLPLGVIWLAANGACYLMYSKSRFSWVGYADFARAHLVGDFAMSAACAVGAVAALRFCIRFGRARPALCYSVVVAVVLIDLGYFNAANFYLQDPTRETIPQEILAIAPPIRYIEVRASGRLPASEVRYSKSVPVAVGYRRSMVGTNDGGILPAATERLYRALEVNPKVALAASACDFEYFSTEHSWRPVADVQPRYRFIAEEHAHLAQVPLERLSRDDLKSLVQTTSVQIRMTNESSQAMSIEVVSPISGVLVLADTNYPGWRCAVDGTAAAIEDVHGVFRGVRVAAGAHNVEFAYKPHSFRWGCLGSLMGIFAVIAIGIACAVRRAKRPTHLPDEVRNAL